MIKKASLVGRGAEIFLRARAETAPPAQQRAGMPGIKATYYLSAEIQNRLDDLWIEKRKLNRKITKSELVSEALEQYLNRGAR